MISRLPTIANAVHQIRQGELTSTELVTFCLARIDQLDPQLGAWELVDAEGALETAAERDSQAAEGDLVGALHGVPIGIKDIVDLAGWPTRAGSRIREKHVADQDAPLVRLLRQAGAILLGKTVTTEFACFDPPRTRNPWNLNHTPGGSSSGSAAAVAAQMCMAAIGTQTGGSIIRPASYCGVCGFKPTFGIVPLAGVVPVSPHLDHAGPIARSVDDAASVFEALLTPSARQVLERSDDSGLPACADDAVDHPTTSADREAQEASPAAATPIRLAPLEAFFQEHASEAAWRIFQDAVGKLGQAVAVASPLPLPAAFAEVHARHRCVMAVDAAAYHRDEFGQRPADFGPHVGSLIRAGLGEAAVDYVRAVAARSEFRDAMCAAMGGETLLIMPATTSPAPTRETTGDPLFNAPWSYAGLPAVTVPCGCDAEGLPCGLQIVGPPNADRRVLQAARQCEAALAFQPPEMFAF